MASRRLLPAPRQLPATRSWCLLAVAATAAALAACSKGATTSGGATVASVSVTPATASVTTGVTTQLDATPLDASGAAVSGQSVAWSSADAAIASVSGSGLVTGVAAGGPVTITATVAGVHGTAAVTVTPPPVATVSLDPATASVAVGASTTLTATLKSAGGQTLAGRQLSWASSNPAVASVSSSGVVTGVSVGGPVTITATSEGKSGTASVTVTPAPVATVSVTPGSPQVFVGATVQLNAATLDANGHAVSGQTVTWVSTNPALASVSSTGLVTGVALGGPVTITATAQGVSGTAMVTVIPVPVASVSVTPVSPQLAVGGTVQLAATARDASGNVLAGRAISWMSTNAAVATVSTGGLVTGVTPGGPIAIVATSEGINGTDSVTVTGLPFLAGWSLRRPITITTTTAAVPTGYSVSVTFDHAAMVSAGNASSDGDDIAIAYWNGSAWQMLDRMLDAGTQWNSSTTTVWFETQAPIAANASDASYYLFYKNPLASAPTTDPAKVFLFSDDFESGSLGHWTVDNGAHWQIDHNRAHSGSAAASYPAEGAGGFAMFAKPALDVADVYVDAWWNVSAVSNAWNVAQGLRQGTGNANKYYSLFCLCIGPALGWNIAEYFKGNYTDLTGPSGAVAANTWMRVGTAMSGSTYRVFLNGSELREVGGLTDLTSGNVALYKYIVPPGMQVWVDDVVARRYVFPEPTTALGMQQPTP